MSTPYRVVPDDGLHDAGNAPGGAYMYARFPDWFVPWSGFCFVNRDARVVVLGYGRTNGHADNTLVGAMDCGGQWAFVNLSEWGDEWAHSAPTSKTACRACLRVDCPSVGGCNAHCAPIAWSNR